MDFYELKEQVENKLHFAKYYQRTDKPADQVEFLELCSQYLDQVEENLHDDCRTQDDIDQACDELRDNIDEMKQEVDDIKKTIKNAMDTSLYNYQEAVKNHDEPTEIAYLDARFKTYKEILELMP